MMPFTVTRIVCLLTLFYVSKGDDSIDFYISQMQCRNGKGTLRLVCSVHYTNINVIKIFKNGIEVSQCQPFLVAPYKYCEYSPLHDGIAHSDIHNVSMIYTIETAKTEHLSGKWVCQNGGPKDPSSSIKVQDITCHEGLSKGHSLSDEHNNCASEQVLRVLISLSLIVAPLFSSYITTIYRCQSGSLQSQSKDHEEKWYKQKIVHQYCLKLTQQTQQKKEPSQGNSHCSRNNCSKKLSILGHCTCGLTTETTIEEGLQGLVCCIMGIIYVVIAIIIVVFKIEEDETTVLFVIVILNVNLASTLFYPLFFSKKRQRKTVVKKTTDLQNDHPETADNESHNSSSTPEGQRQTVVKKTTDLQNDHPETADNESHSSSSTPEGQRQTIVKKTTDLQNDHPETADNESHNSSSTPEDQRQIVLRETTDLQNDHPETADNESHNSSSTPEDQFQTEQENTTGSQNAHSETAEIESLDSSYTSGGSYQTACEERKVLLIDQSVTTENETANSSNPNEGQIPSVLEKTTDLPNDQSNTEESETQHNSFTNKGYKITLCSFIVMLYIAIAIFISVKNMKIDLRTGLSTVCFLEGILVFSFVSIIMTSKESIRNQTNTEVLKRTPNLNSKHPNCDTKRTKDVLSPCSRRSSV